MELTQVLHFISPMQLKVLQKIIITFTMVILICFMIIIGNKKINLHYFNFGFSSIVTFSAILQLSCD